jgi:hypothetical protein
LSDLRRDELPALEDADREAAEPDERHADAVVLGNLLEQQSSAQDVLVGGVA